MSDKGFGKFGSIEWHENYINGIESRSEVCWYVFDVCEGVLKPCGTIEQTRDNAIAMIRGSI